MIKIIYRKGDERVLSLYWFVMFIIVSIAVISGVILFYGQPLDVRPLESQLFADAVIKCVGQQGHLAPVFGQGASVDLDRECNLFLQDMTNAAYEQEGQYYVELKVSSGDNIAISQAGNEQLKALCDSAASNKRIPVCTEKKFMLLLSEKDKSNTLTLITILTAVRKVEQNGG